MRRIVRRIPARSVKSSFRSGDVPTIRPLFLRCVRRVHTSPNESTLVGNGQPRTEMDEVPPHSHVYPNGDFMKKILVPFAVCTVVAAAPAVRAQGSVDTETGALEQITVVAQKRSENLQKIPIAVSVLDESQLATTGVTTTQDLAFAVPGLQILNQAGQDSPRVRGVGASVAGAGLESPVATYVDGVYYASAADVVMNLSDVSQVSILKGPQGTLFGRNATGGVLQITTRDPTQEFHATASTDLDNFFTWRTGVYVSGGLTDKLTAGLSAQYTTQRNGWGTNIYDGAQTFKIDRDYSFRMKLIYSASDDTTVKLEGDFSSRSGNPDANFRPFPGYNALIPGPQTSSPWDVDDYMSTRDTYKGGGASVTVTQELGFAKLSSISAYRSSAYSFDFTPFVSDVDIFNLRIPDHSMQYTEELQLVSPSDGRFTWATGLFYFYNRATTDDTLFGPAISPFSQIAIVGAQDSTSIAGFGQGTYHLTDSTRLTVGLRYTHERKAESAGEQYGTFPGGPTIVLVPGPTPPNDVVTFGKPTWRLSLDHDITGDMVGYVSYNRGFKSGGFNILAPGNPPFQPEQLDAYEVGFKDELFQHRARLNVAAFYYDYKEIQVPIFNLTQIIVNGAASRIYGLDEEFTANVTDAVRITANTNYLHARFTSFPNAQFTIPNPGNAGATITSGDAGGNTLPYSPTFTYLLGVDYTIPSKIGSFTLNLNDSYNSGFYGEPDNRLRQQSFHFLNSSVAWKANDGHTTVRVYGNNLLNRAVANQFNSQNIGYIADFSSPPRIYGIKAQYDF
jgi:iron complex outermembrane recepter protein